MWPEIVNRVHTTCRTDYDSNKSLTVTPRNTSGITPNVHLGLPILTFGLKGESSASYRMECPGKENIVHTERDCKIGMSGWQHKFDKNLRN